MLTFYHSLAHATKILAIITSSSIMLMLLAYVIIQPKFVHTISTIAIKDFSWAMKHHTQQRKQSWWNKTELQFK